MLNLEDYDAIRPMVRKAIQALRGCSTGLSPFLDEWGTSLYISELMEAGDIRFIDSGGLPGASRRIVAFFSCEEIKADAIPFVYLSVKPASGLMRPPIEDVLNTLNQAGFVKDTDVGDVFGDETGYFAIAVDRKGIFPPAVSRIEAGEIIISKVDRATFEKWERWPSEKETTTASIRLDAVVSVCMNISRSKAKKMIEAGLVMVDYTLVRKAEKPVESGSILSVAGKRRVLISAIDGPTKKGRWRVRFGYLP